MADPKLQRWIDLLAALLAHRHPVTFDELAANVPAYRDTGGTRAKKLASIKRTFERDKAELLALGVPIHRCPPMARRNSDISSARRSSTSRTLASPPRAG